MLKQQGVNVKGMVKGNLVNEVVPPLLEGVGKIEVKIVTFFELASFACNFGSLLVVVILLKE